MRTLSPRNSPRACAPCSTRKPSAFSSALTRKTSSTPSSSALRSNGAISISSQPASILDTSRTSDTSRSSVTPGSLDQPPPSRAGPGVRGRSGRGQKDDDDPVHGGADLVAHIGQEVALGAVAGIGGSRGPRAHLSLDRQPLGDVAGDAGHQVADPPRSPFQVTIAAVLVAIAIDVAPDLLLGTHPLHVAMGLGRRRRDGSGRAWASRPAPRPNSRAPPPRRGSPSTKRHSMSRMHSISSDTSLQQEGRPRGCAPPAPGAGRRCPRLRGAEGRIEAGVVHAELAHRGVDGVHLGHALASTEFGTASGGGQDVELARDRAAARRGAAPGAPRSRAGRGRPPGPGRSPRRGGARGTRPAVRSGPRPRWSRPGGRPSPKAKLVRVTCPCGPSTEKVCGAISRYSGGAGPRPRRRTAGPWSVSRRTNTWVRPVELGGWGARPVRQRGPGPPVGGDIDAALLQAAPASPGRGYADHVAQPWVRLRPAPGGKERAHTLVSPGHRRSGLAGCTWSRSKGVEAKMAPWPIRDQEEAWEEQPSPGRRFDPRPLAARRICQWAQRLPQAQ